MCMSTIRQHCWGLIHTGVVEHSMENTIHTELDVIACRIVYHVMKDYIDWQSVDPKGKIVLKTPLVL
jgi:hypothetical protein